MRLKRIALSGFKTFARRSEVVFQPGITGVVGPNGSGKSNLVDAIRWALGETNAREIRGSRMEEVIYAGGAGRSRMAIAEVELVIDNEESRLPVDDPEVAISRRVVRGGDIEYRINGARARLRDVERLLGATGLTQAGYAVVGQSDIDAIIEATPRQRRALVEQAAGVRPLRVACEDALRRLGQADIAVDRLVDRLDEAEPRFHQLEVEAEAALEQRELSQRLAELRGSLAREEWRAARAQRKQAGRRLDAAERRLDAAGEAETAFTERLERERAELGKVRQAQRHAADRLEAARLGAERAGGEVRRWSDRRTTAVLHRAGARAEQAAALTELVAAELAAVELEGSALGLREQSQKLEGAVAAAADRAEAALAAAAESERSVLVAEADLKAAVDEVVAAEASTAQLVAQLTLFDEAALAMQAELSETRVRAAELDLVAAATGSRRSQQEDFVRAAAQAGEEAASVLATARARLREAEATLMAFRESARQAVARAASLQGQLEGTLGGGGAIAASAAEIGAVRLIDLIRVRDPTDVAAIEASLESHLGAWIVEDIGPAIDRLRDSSAREEVLAAGPPANEGSGSSREGVRSALSAVEVAPPAGAAASYCLAATWLVSDMAAAGQAVSRLGGRGILPDGTVVSAAGVRGGGGAGDTLELAAAAQTCRAVAESAQTEEIAAEAEVRYAHDALGVADGIAASRSDELAATQLALGDATAAHAAALAAATAEMRRVEVLEEALRRRARESSAVADAATIARDRVAAAVVRQRGAKATVGRSQQFARELRRQHEVAAEQFRELELRLLELRRTAADLERRGAEFDRQRQSAGHRVGVAENRVAAAETEALIAMARGRRARFEAAEAARAVVLAFEDLELTGSPLTDLEARVQALEQERGEVLVVVARAQDEVSAARAEVDAAQLRVAELAEIVRDEIEDDAVELDPGTAEKAEREITRLERRIAAMGPVNGLAPEQCAALGERIGILRDHRDDLSVAASEVRNLARRLSGEAQRRFETVFVAVGAHFAELFGELFPGGSATLHLEEAGATGEDELETPEERQQRRGIEILAQPPGKKLQPLNHLSGGERALTSMAVIFALQQVNPSPFYVFDEVDAPLDDTNVVRFSRLLGRLAQTQQFIVITHNHVTMAAADALYGVTIDREGISSVLSVRFSSDSLLVRDVVGVVAPPLRRAAS